jgi:O-antigen chain-terminating methyltransferase
MTVDIMLLHARVSAQITRRDGGVAGNLRDLSKLVPPTVSCHASSVPDEDGFDHLEPDLNGLDTSSAGIKRLLGLHDEQFVKAAYRVVLRREPDQDGFSHYLTLLRGGTASKVNILIRFFRSEEGRSRSKTPAWLWVRFLAEQLLKLPIIGYLIDLLQSIVRLPSLKRSLERTDLHQYAQINRVDHAATAALRRLRHISAGSVRSGSGSSRRAKAASARSLHALESAVSRLECRLDTLDSDLQDLKLGGQSLDRALSGRRGAALKAALEASNYPRTPDEMVKMFLRHHCEMLRGDERDIKQRLEVYLPFVSALPAAGLPVLDLGSGRGEWLKVLAENGIRGHGIEINWAFVEGSRGAGHSVRHGDFLELLDELSDCSQRAVTAFHVIEHIHLEDQLALLTHAKRILAPAGALIIETPDPLNPTVGYHDFYKDPTHLKPVPVDLWTTMLDFAGFGRYEILRLNPDEEAKADVATTESGVSAGRDYAVIAYKED